MTKLYVIYDAGCGFCARCRRFLIGQRALVPLQFVRSDAPDLGRRFPGLTAESVAAELTVVSDDGRVWRGAKAFVMCLWALRRYRALSVRLARPSLLPLARQAFDLLSHRRRALSRLFGLRSDQEVGAVIAMNTVSTACDVAPWPAGVPRRPQVRA